MNALSAENDGLTPLMRQYYRIKAQYPDKILFFRMGDFYEMFGDDAVRAAPILNVALTSRGIQNGEKIPLAGVPYHAADKYLARLLKAGEKVVVVEQVEDPRTAKGIVKREVVEILTPGTATLESSLEEMSASYLAALAFGAGDQVGLAYIDLTTGEFRLDEGSGDNILEKLYVLAPQEVIYPSGENEPELITRLRRNNSFILSGYEGWNFDTKTAVRELSDFWGVSSLDGFGVGDKPVALAAAGAIYRYLRENHRERLDHVTKISTVQSDRLMQLDYSTIRNLELVTNLSENSERDTLFGVVNRTVTAGGARRLRQAILRPFITLEPIRERQAVVAELYHRRDTAGEIRESFKEIPDLERLAGRLGMRKINPRQMASLGQGLTIMPRIAGFLGIMESPLLRKLLAALPDFTQPVQRLGAALTEEPPLTANKGGVIRAGYAPELDALVNSIRDAKSYIASLQTTERQRTGISSLRVGFNKVFGYYIEVTKSHLDKIPPDYIRKQTLVNAERFITAGLKEKEELILAAEEKIFALEESLYVKLMDEIAEDLEDILLGAEIISEIDLVSALAELAYDKMYCCPEISEKPVLIITSGRHPVIENILPPGSFIPNNVTLSIEGQRIMILTGPNMSGKSTYLRQAGLIVILAQIGSFVPAEKAEIGLVDRIFTRVGAIDNLARGQSTFLVEMIETANIMHNASERSLILLDEVGRGTSTFDGLSIAWSVVEYINEHIRARTVFATHYHELTGLAALYERIVNFQVAVKRWEKEVIFLHKIIPGGCDDSYGIEVARLAGLPKMALGRAREILRLLESGKFNQSELARGLHREIMQRTLFDKIPSAVEEEIQKINPEALTPLEALRILDKLKGMLDED